LLIKSSVLPNIIAKNVHSLNPLSIGSLTIFWNGKRFYIGEIMDVFKKGANSRYGSVPGATSVSGLAYLSVRVYLKLGTSTTRVSVSFSFNNLSLKISQSKHEYNSDDELPVKAVAAPLFSCYHDGSQIRLHTHAKVEHLLFNLGPNAFEQADLSTQTRKLKPHAAECWTTLTSRGRVNAEVEKLTLKIGRRKDVK
jgi:hypothetical protein